MSTESRATGDQVMQAFASLRLTMFLLICLAVVSIIGTIIPQGQLPPEYLASIGGEQGNRFKLYSLLGFFDMYHSWWFVGLLTTLTLGIGGPYAQLRTARFIARHTYIAGSHDFDSMVQSNQTKPRQGEGLMEMFDTGGVL